MEVEGRKEARRMNKKEEEEKKCRRRMKKVINIKEVEKKETTELESSSGYHQVLQKAEESSFLFWGEGALLKSTGFEEKCFLDGTRVDENQRLSVALTTCMEEDEESESKFSL